ncbi:14922_t:CDS:2 [Acaulospora colombiana]|uniref:14922_t:CDS:1 n=1 Tax=Acaulospora colombiana TaxID=27376 RepID=A0ACA9KLR7_9GLOM|nr:14922_t:CDS:2 [Acaulospora colombiana]
MPPKSHNKRRKPARGGGHRFTNPRHLSNKEDVEGGDLWEYQERNEDIKSSESGSENESERVEQNIKVLNASNSMSSGSEIKSKEEEKDAVEIEIENPNRGKKDNLKVSEISNTPREMSRREREAAEKEAAKQRYWKLHREGKTDQAKADLARLAVIKKEREQAAIQRKAEAEAKAEAQKAKLERDGRKSRK